MHVLTFMVFKGVASEGRGGIQIVRSHVIPGTTVKAHARTAGVSQAESHKEVVAQINQNF